MPGDRVQRSEVPGFHPVPKFPKKSALSSVEHYKMLKVLCARNREILPADFIAWPTQQDLRLFIELENTYAKEQIEFIEWAKQMWINHHFVRALRPKPLIEAVYDAEFRLTSNRFQKFPTNFSLSSQISLASANTSSELEISDILIEVKPNTLPEVEIPDLTKRVYIMEAISMPKPVANSPCRFMLPNETTMTKMPLTIVQKELAQYAASNGAQFIASEEALRCLLEMDRHWLMTISIFSVTPKHGKFTTAVVLDTEFALRRESAVVRTQKSFDRLLDHALLSSAAELKDEEELDSDDDSNHDSDENSDDYETIDEYTDVDSDDDEPLHIDSDKYHKLPKRSYTKWTNNALESSIIIHCPHKYKDDRGHLVPMALNEYQLDVGARALTADELRVQALALLLRQNASILIARIDNPTGEIVKTEKVYHADFLFQHRGVMPEVHGRLHSMMEQLRGMRPGTYVLQHTIALGENANVYGSQPTGVEGELTLHFNSAQLAEDDNAMAVPPPPTITAALLPIHKFRKVLPCAFMPFPKKQPRPPRPKRSHTVPMSQDVQQEQHEQVASGSTPGTSTAESADVDEPMRQDCQESLQEEPGVSGGYQEPI